MALLGKESEEHLGHDQRGVHRDDDAATEGHGEATDRTGTEDEENDTGHQRGDVRIENRDEGPVIACLDSVPQLLAALLLLADTFEDEHIGVDRHADGQQDTRDTRQGEHRQLDGSTLDGAAPCA